MTGSPKREKFQRLPLHANEVDVTQALADLRTLWDPTPRMRAERRVQAAKAEYTAATEALIRRDLGAEARADAALEEFTAARAALALLDAQTTEPRAADYVVCTGSTPRSDNGRA